MTGNSRPGSTLNSPVQNEDKNRIKDNVRHSTRNRRNHSESRSAVSTNDGIQHVAEHVDWKEADDNIIILTCIDDIVSSGTSEIEDLVAEDETEHNNDNANEKSNRDTTTDGAMSTLRVLASLTNRKKGSRTVAEHATRVSGKTIVVAALPTAPRPSVVP